MGSKEEKKELIVEYLSKTTSGRLVTDIAQYIGVSIATAYTYLLELAIHDVTEYNVIKSLQTNRGLKLWRLKKKIT